MPLPHFLALALALTKLGKCPICHFGLFPDQPGAKGSIDQWDPCIGACGCINGMCVGGSGEQEREAHHASAPRMKKAGLCGRPWAGRRRSHSLLPRPGEDNSTVVEDLRAKESVLTQTGEPGGCPHILAKTQRSTLGNGRANYHQRQASP